MTNSEYAVCTTLPNGAESKKSETTSFLFGTSHIDATKVTMRIRISGGFAQEKDGWVFYFDKPFFLPEEKIMFSIFEMREILKEMEKMNAIRH